jgi:multimeric flavodoxin WrbA
MRKRLLIVYGGRPGGRTERLREAVAEGIRDSGEDVELREVHALAATSEEVLWAEGLLLGTPEHFGYMSGALKDFFDRTFHDCEGRTEGRPWGLFVSAGNDGRGTCNAVERIVTGYRWTSIAAPVIVVGEPEAAGLARCRELGATLAAGLAAGIF